MQGECSKNIGPVSDDTTTFGPSPLTTEPIGALTSCVVVSLVKT